MNSKTQLVCVHGGLLSAVLLGLGIFGIAGWFPPIEPSLGATDIATLFKENPVRIRIGMTVLALASVFWWPFSAAISMQMKRIEGDKSHPLTYVNMGAASGTVVAILIPAYFWLALAYRPESTSPETMQLINDFCWLSFIGMYPPGFLQCLAVGFCVLSDKSAKPVYPRWIGYANLWVAVGFMPGALLPFFHSGPFSWNGIIGFWLVATLFFGWIVMMWWYTVKAIKQQGD